ncbi:hypothetical protein [uncultured Roseobacter sp.]|uniref:hypothetical protein n=1 Tax=uncultured Roseobacter sp. TaxID=114847 RepID=UPI00261D16DB|nr:hypothetical protein [uncultured Roseobacter sp.]
MTLDGFSDQKLSASAGRTIANISEATAADERSVIVTQETSDLRQRIADQTLTQTSGYLVGDQILCAGESLFGGLLSLSGNPVEKIQGEVLQQSCVARAKRGGDVLRGEVTKSLSVDTGH